MDIQQKREQAIRDFVNGLKRLEGHKFRQPGGLHDALTTKLFDTLGDLEVEAEVLAQSANAEARAAAAVARDRTGRYAPGGGAQGAEPVRRGSTEEEIQATMQEMARRGLGRI